MIHALGLDVASAGREAGVEDARAFAAARHEAHEHDDPAYLAHLDEVHAIAAAHGLPAAVRVAAYLHELLADTDASEDELLERFGPEVLVLVDGVTGRGATSRERMDDVVHKLRAFRPAILLEMCDRLASTWSSAREGNEPLLERYRAEWRTLQPVFAEMRKPAPALYQRLLDVSEGASGFYAGDRVRLVKVRPDVGGPLKPGDTGVVQGVQETFQPERMVRVLVDGQAEARALWPDELAHAQ
jgi:hypothetical protein